VAYSRDYPAFPQITTPPCIYLRNKAMFVRGVENDPSAFPEETNTPQCWCNHTQHFVGPDGQYVGRPECIPGRECYRETYE
jgi:hypothetical protein